MHIVYILQQDITYNTYMTSHSRMPEKGPASQFRLGPSGYWAVFFPSLLSFDVD